MTGEKQIIAARLKGLKPTSIFFEIGAIPKKTKFQCDDAEMALEQGMYPTGFIDDLKQKIDVRFAVGCVAHVHANQIDDDVLTFAERLEKVASKVVVCSVNELMVFEDGVWNASSYE